MIRAVEQHNFWVNVLQVLDRSGHATDEGWVSSSSPSRATTDNAYICTCACAGVHASTSKVQLPTSTYPTEELPKPKAVSPYTHLHALLAHSCFPCRLNAPHAPFDPAPAQRGPLSVHPSLRLDPIPLCAAHTGTRHSKFCGVCLLDREIQARVKEEAVWAAHRVLEKAGSAMLGWPVGWNHGLSGASCPCPCPPAHPPATAEAEAETQMAPFAAAAPTAVEAEAQHATGATLPDAPQSTVEAARADIMTAWKAIGWPGSTEHKAGVTWNEDESVFPGVGVTCRSCRAEWLSRCVERGEVSSAAAASDVREE
jgi:hypothetical protein